MKQAELQEQPLSSKDRVEALSDGVFAIVMTLLVFNLSGDAIADAKTAEDFHSALFALWPKFLAYALSFVVISMLWISHHACLGCVRGSNATHMWLNLMFLFFVTIIPFSADLLGEHHGFAVTGFIYGLNLVAVFSSLVLIFWYASRRLLYEDINPAFIQQVHRRWVSVTIAYVVGMILAGFFPKGAFFLYAAIITIHLLFQLRAHTINKFRRHLSEFQDTKS